MISWFIIEIDISIDIFREKTFSEREIIARQRGAEICILNKNMLLYHYCHICWKTKKQESEICEIRDFDVYTAWVWKPP